MPSKVAAAMASSLSHPNPVTGLRPSPFHKERVVLFHFPRGLLSDLLLAVTGITVIGEELNSLAILKAEVLQFPYTLMDMVPHTLLMFCLLL
nr:hypothetical protein Iba_chr04cCG11780 [Ipomoea batatas]